VEQDTAVDAPPSVIGVLEEHLRRYPPDRYPVQHATAQFHLGVALTNAARAEEAEAALAAAVRLFEQSRLAVEQAKALNALGAALRLSGRREPARDAFERAVGAFEALDRPLEEGAAAFNLGLVLRELGDDEGARVALERARRLLDPAPAQAAAAARELGALLLQAGHESATPTLRQAVELAEQADDLAGRGAAANALGLALLGEDDVHGAVGVLRAAVASHPRSVRPREFAMAQANLALAWERAGEAERARVAARHAVGVPSAPPPVREQAESVLRRLGPGDRDLLALVATAPEDERAVLVRDEVARWGDVDDERLREELGVWIDEGLATGGDELAELLLNVLLELLPRDLERIAGSLLLAAAERGQDVLDDAHCRVRDAARSFHAPQADRLQDVFARAAAEAGIGAAWSSPAT
jgi:tetratricopeptide (TPR) repeat protein